MDPTLKAFLVSWDFQRPDVIGVLSIFSTLYAVGWIKLRRKQSQLATWPRLMSYYAGIATIILALFSSIDTFQSQLFFMHMTQHLLLMMAAPPLLWLGNPMPLMMWAIPRKERQQLGRLLVQKSLFRRIIVTLTSPWLAWVLYSCNLWMWHDPNFYNTSTTNEFVHDIQHLTFFFSGMILWWNLTDAAPQFHGDRNYVKRLGIVVADFFSTMILGVILTMSGTVIYSHYETVPRIAGISALYDQMIGGLLMWIPTGVFYICIFLLLLSLQIQYSENRSRLKNEQRRLKLKKEILA